MLLDLSRSLSESGVSAINEIGSLYTIIDVIDDTPTEKATAAELFALPAESSDQTEMLGCRD